VNQTTIEGARPGTERLRVVVADDQQLVRTGFRMILAADGIEVVGEAANGVAAIEAVRRTRPDVVLMDIRMPELDGLEATRLILAEPTDPIELAGPTDPRDAARPAVDGEAVATDPRPRIIILTTFDLDQYVYEALAAGASGFLLKDVTPEHLVNAVRLVRSGDALLAPTITRRLVEKFAAPTPASEHRVRAARAELSTLTARELEVFHLLARGLSNAELAERLQLSEATIKTHVARILAKLQLRDRAQAVVAAYETGLVTPGNPDAPGGSGR
jgi:DNA-binding NarL/FixJ family response regulator